MSLIVGKRTTKRNKSHQADKRFRTKDKGIEQENASLKTIMQIREDEYKQAQNEKDNENHRPWQIIKPVQLRGNANYKIEVKIQFLYLPPTDLIVLKIMKWTAICLTKVHLLQKIRVHPQRITVIVGDSLLKGIRQHSITKASKTKTLVKCFPGSKINDMKHYCIPVLGTKPEHAIIHCGTNDLRASSLQEITKQMGGGGDCMNLSSTIVRILT